MAEAADYLGQLIQPIATPLQMAQLQLQRQQEARARASQQQQMQQIQQNMQMAQVRMQQELLTAQRERAQTDQDRQASRMKDLRGMFDKANNDAGLAAVRREALAAGYDPQTVQMEYVSRQQELQQEIVEAGGTAFNPNATAQVPGFSQADMPFGLAGPPAVPVQPSLAGTRVVGGQRYAMPPQYTQIQSGPAAGTITQWQPGQPPVVGMPPGGGTTTSGKGMLGEDIQAQKIMIDPNSTPEQKAGARDFLVKQSGGELGLAEREISQLKTPEERQAWLQENDPATLDYIKGVLAADTPITGFSATANQIRKIVKSVYPQADFTAVAKKQGFWANYGNPGSTFNQNITSLNTVAAHLGELNQAIENTKLSGQPIQNFFDLAVKQITGDPTVTALNAPEMAVILETHRALSGVGVTDQEARNWATLLPKKAVSYQQAKQFVKSISALVNQRLTVQQENVNRIFSPGPKIQEILGPDYRPDMPTVIDPIAEESLNRILGGEPGQPQTAAGFTIKQVSP